MVRYPLSRAVSGSLIITTLLLAAPAPTWAWGWGHKFINLWAIQRLPEWQKDYFGREHLAKLPEEYRSIQDAYTGSKSPVWAPYCNPPVRASLHDPGSAEASVINMAWYLHRINQHLQAGEPDEAMKFLGVLCHWNEDPGSPSAHNRYLTETFLQAMIPSPENLLSRTYTFGYKGIYSFDASSEKALHDEEVYTPRLLGVTPEEAAARIYQRQRHLALRSAQTAVRALVYYTDGEAQKSNACIRDQATYNARLVTDIMYTAGCLASGRIDPEAREMLATEPLSTWLPVELFTDENLLYARPYYTRPYLVNYSYDAARGLHPLGFAGGGPAAGQGFGTTVPYDLTFTIAPGSVFGQFSVRAGLHGTATDEGRAIFAILIDDEEVVRLPELQGGEPPVEVVLDLPDATSFQLTLRTIRGEGANAAQCLAVWGDPTLHRRVKPAPPRFASANQHSFRGEDR